MSGIGSTLLTYKVLFRRIGSMVVDLSIEFVGGLLGSYFGAMVAALVTALKHHDPVVMQESIWRGLGFGFVFCALSISFVNRVLIQGLSRASLGKKLFKLELLSTRPITWRLMMKRWILSEVSLATFGAGYIVMFFNPEHRAFHDMALGMDVAPVFGSHYSVSMEYHTEEQVLPFPKLASRTLVLEQEDKKKKAA